MSYQSQLNNLIQMATIEQLNMMLIQNRTNTESESNNNNKTDVLNLPIVQKVVLAYEDELKTKSPCKCANYEHQLEMILAKLDTQTSMFNQVLSKLEEIHVSTKKMVSEPGLEVALPKEEYLVEEVAEEVLVEEVEEEVLEEEVLEPAKNEIHITLDIEETETEPINNVDIQSIVSDDEEEKVEEVSEEEDSALAKEEVSEEVAEEVEAEEEVSALAKEEVSEEVEEEEEAVEAEVEVLEEEESESEEEVVSVVSEAKEAEAEEESEEEVFEIEIDDITYFATDEENGILYEVDSEGEVGKQVGIIKDGEPIFS